MVPCGRLSWLLVHFWAHVKISVSHRLLNLQKHWRQNYNHPLCEVENSLGHQLTSACWDSWWSSADAAGRETAQTIPVHFASSRLPATRLLNSAHRTMSWARPWQHYVNVTMLRQQLYADVQYNMLFRCRQPHHSNAASHTNCNKARVNVTAN